MLSLAFIAAVLSAAVLPFNENFEPRIYFFVLCTNATIFLRILKGLRRGAGAAPVAARAGGAATIAAGVNNIL